MDDATVSRLVTGKARRFLRTNSILLIGSLILLSSAFTYAEAQFLHRQRDFDRNANVHVIEVTAPADGESGSQLKFADLARIGSQIDLLEGVGPTSVTVQYALGFGIPDSSGADRFFYGLDGEGGRLLGLAPLEAGVAYSVAAPTLPNLDVRVPVVDVTNAGMSSGDSVAVRLRAVGGVSPSSPLMVLGRPDSEALYVEGTTFQRLVTTAFETDWRTFRERYDRDNPYGIQVIKSVHIYVHDLAGVKVVAESLTESGFDTAYTLKAFDDLAGSLRSSTIASLLAVLAIFMGCAVYITMSFNSYMNLAHRDMGILRHLGYSSERVRRLFARRVARTSAIVGGGVVLYTIVIGMAFLGTGQLRLVGFNVLTVVVLLSVVHLITVRLVFRSHARTPVLRLLKLDREFE